MLRLFANNSFEALTIEQRSEVESRAHCTQRHFLHIFTGPQLRRRRGKTWRWIRNFRSEAERFKCYSTWGCDRTFNIFPGAFQRQRTDTKVLNALLDVVILVAVLSARAMTLPTTTDDNDETCTKYKLCFLLWKVSSSMSFSWINDKTHTHTQTHLSAFYQYYVP